MATSQSAVLPEQFTGESLCNYSVGTLGLPYTKRKKKTVFHILWKAKPKWNTTFYIIHIGASDRANKAQSVVGGIFVHRGEILGCLLHP